MTGVRVVSDTACDLPDDIVSGLGIGLVPLRIRFGEEELLDRHQLSSKEFWSRCASAADLPGTAAPSPGQFQEAFEAMAQSGADAVVCVNLSSKMSATIESARAAAKALEGRLPVVVVDSMTVTLGQGLVVLRAAERAAAGADLDQVAEAARQAAQQIKLYGTLDTLENLKKGGRIGGARAFLGSVLSIKPIIEVRDGEVQEEGKQRTRRRSFAYLTEKVKAAGPISDLALFGGDAGDFDEFAGFFEDLEVSGRRLKGDIGPVIGTHAGPGSVGVAWLPA